MSKQLVDMIEAVAYEKDMPLDVVQSAMESAIAALARREQKAPEGVFRAEIEKDGTVNAFRVWAVVDDIEDPEKEILRADHQGDEVTEQVETPKWTRQGLQIVKQVLSQRLKQGLRSTIAEGWSDRVGDVVMGTVKRIDKGRIVIDLGEPVEGVIAGRDRIPGEVFKVGHRCRALVTKVTADGSGPVITLSRSADEFVRELVAIEVPEVELGQVVIKAVARDPGARCKVAVEAGIGLRSSPAAVCVGMRGVRAQAVSNEINGERIEFIEWSDNPAELLLASLAPAEVSTMLVYEDQQKITVGVAPENLARAIGSRGQNVRLASRLTGWTIDLMSVDDLEAKQAQEDQDAQSNLMDLLDIDEDMAQLLVEEGFMTVEEILYSPIGNLLVIDGFDEDIVAELHERARNTILLKEMLNSEEIESDAIETIAQLDGISGEDVHILANQGIVSLQDLADQGTMDVEWDEERDDELNAWIMQARRLVGMI